MGKKFDMLALGEVLLRLSPERKRAFNPRHQI